MNTSLLKGVDALLGAAGVYCLPQASVKKPASEFNRILLIRPGGIGDAVLLAPAIRLIKTIYPDCQLTILAEHRNAGVFALIPGVKRLYCYDTPSEFIQTLRNNYDVVIDTEQWHRLSAVVARFIRAPIKIGFATNERRRMFTHTVPYSHDDYEAESFLHLLEPLKLVPPADWGNPFLIVPENTKNRVNTLLEPFQGKPYFAIFPGASIVERRWGRERFRMVAEGLQQHGYGIAVIGAAEDSSDAGHITVAGGLNLAGRTSLAETAAVLARSALLVSGDSGVLHIAVGLGVPTVSLFGPGRALKWAPLGNQHIVINKQLPCSPCTTFGTTPPCPYDARCMKEITVEEVVTAASHLLQKHGL